MKVLPKNSDFSQSHDSFSLWKSPRKQKWDFFLSVKLEIHVLR